MKQATKDILYFEIGKDNPPTLHEEFEVETQMNAGPWLEVHPQGEELRKKLVGGNPSSGCIFLKGAKPGDILTVHIGEIRLADIGYTRFLGNNSAMPAWFGASCIGKQEKIVRIENKKFFGMKNLRYRLHPCSVMLELHLHQKDSI